MNRIIFILLILFFYLDFSFLPNLFHGHWHTPYFLITFLMVLIIKRDFQKNIWVFLGGTYLLSIALGISWWLVILAWLIVWAMVYFLKAVFLEDNLSPWQANLIFVIIVVVYFLSLLLIDKFALAGQYYFEHWFDWLLYLGNLLIFFNFNLYLFNRHESKKKKNSKPGN